MKEYEDDGLTPAEDSEFKEIETGGKLCVAKGQDRVSHEIRNVMYTIIETLDSIVKREREKEDKLVSEVPKFLPYSTVLFICGVCTR